MNQPERRTTTPESALESVLKHVDHRHVLELSRHGVRLYEFLDELYSDGPTVRPIKKAKTIASLSSQLTAPVPDPVLLKLPDEPSWHHNLLSPQQVMDVAVQKLEQQPADDIESSEYRQRHPKLRLINLLDERSVDLTLDIPKLLVEKEIDLTWRLPETVTRSTTRVIGSLGISLTNLFQRATESIGVDAAQSAYLSLDELDHLEPFWLTIDGLNARYDIAAHTAVQLAERTQRKDPSSPERVLARIEQQVVERFNHTPYMSKEGIWLAQAPLEFRPLRSLDEAVEDTIIAIEQRGGALGIIRGTITTGNEGWIICITDGSGEPVVELHGHYDVRMAIENSWLRLADGFTQA